MSTLDNLHEKCVNFFVKQEGWYISDNIKRFAIIRTKVNGKLYIVKEDVYDFVIDNTDSRNMRINSVCLSQKRINNLRAFFVPDNEYSWQYLIYNNFNDIFSLKAGYPYIVPDIEIDNSLYIEKRLQINCDRV